MEIPNNSPEESPASEIRSERSPTGSALGWTPPAVEEIAQLFPQYETLALIAHGGMGAVYRARQIALDREVAIKLLPIEVSGDQSYADRFVREGRAMAKLNHPNIVAVHDFGTTTEGHLFLTMEYIEGATLHDFIHAGNLTLNQSLYIIEQVCDALAYAHSLGIVHRDIKPANVMVDLSLRAKVADFGLARITKSSDSQLGITMTGQIMGTPNYIAPEQLQAMSVDHRADIYSLGVMLYETVAREIPRGIFLPLSQRCGVDLRLDGIVTRAMQQQPERRFQSTSEMKALVTSVRTTRRSAPAPPPRKKRTALWIGIGAAAAALIAALVFLMQDEQKPTVVAAPKPTPLITNPPPTPQPPPVAVVTPEPAVKPVPETPPPVAQPEPKSEPKSEPASSPKPPSEIAEWLLQMDTQFSPTYQRDVIEIFENGVAKLREQYTAAIARSITTASAAGRLEDSLALRNEQARLTAGRLPHEDIDEASDPTVLRQLRDNWRKAYAKLDTDRFAKAKATHARYDASLAQKQNQLTQSQRLDDALLLKNKREEIRAAWLTPPVEFGKSAAPAATPKPLGTAMDAQKPNAGLLSGREAMLHLQSLNFNVSCIDTDGRTVGLENDATVPSSFKLKGRLEIYTLSQSGVLRVDGQPVTDADFASLAPMRKLTNIAISANVTGSGLGFLVGSPDLRTVSFTTNSLTDAAFEPLLGLHKIEEFTATSGVGTLTWARFGEMKSLPGFTHFSTNHAEAIPPAGLARARKLQRLYLPDSRFTEEHFAAIGSLPELVSFSFSGDIETSAAGLLHLEKCPKLTQLGLGTRSGLRPYLGFIGKMRKLTSLLLDGADAPGLAAAAGAPALRTISLDGQIGISQGASDEGLNVIADSFPRLEELVFPTPVTRTVTAEGIRALAKLPKLKTFDWGGRPLPVELATELAALPALDSLVLRSCGNDETQFRELAKSKSLTKLDVAYEKLTPAAIEALKEMRGLRDLFVMNCGLTPADLAALRKALPQCSLRDG